MKNPVNQVLKFLSNKFTNIGAQAINKNQYKRGLITEIEYELRKDFLREVEQFGTNDFYQNYPPLKISGKRNTLCRYQIYGLDEKVNREDTVLDIGGNIGFFSLYLSRYVKSIDLVEQNTHLTDIGQRLAEHQGITNVNIVNEDFKKYIPSKKYDLVMSLAIHKWVGLEFDEYLDRIHALLNKNGKVLIESHIIYQNKGDYIEPLLKKNQKFEIVEKGVIDDHDGQYREFFWLKSK
jgi:2-polyprenyl-3-methyl-5-hydroxy-6-metoxy-1,4-benzoquinol methylase